MKSMDIKRIGTIATGAMMLGAALAGPVGAGMDDTGLTGNFFYDASYNPIMQIVVGEKGMATDAVAAGNIAAAVGNLAYMESTKTITLGGEATGKVIVETEARGAVGKYVQDTDDVTIRKGFYDADLDTTPEDLDPDGDRSLRWDDDERKYERGDFTHYSLSACKDVEETEAAILTEMTSSNVHCLFCQTLCLEALENPSHEMKESITVNNSKLWYYESGVGDKNKAEYLEMAVDEGAIRYEVETGYIPMDKRLTEVHGMGEPAKDYWVDFEYKGKILFFGEEYYVKKVLNAGLEDPDDTDSNAKIVLANGKVLTDITSEGYTSEYMGYKFKIDHLIYSGEYEVAGILLTIQKPDGTEVQRQISKMSAAILDNLEITGVYAEAAAGVETGSIIVYDKDSDIVLENGEKLIMGGVTYDEWTVNLRSGACNMTGDCESDISEYSNLQKGSNRVLEKITVTLDTAFEEDDALRVGDSLDIPGEFSLTFKGYLTSNFGDRVCSGDGEGNIEITRGSDSHEIVMSFTASNGERYDARMDTGPFAVDDSFIIGGKLYSFYSAKIEKESPSINSKAKITIKPEKGGERRKLTLYRYCDPKDGAASNCSISSVPTCNCSQVDDPLFRTIALDDGLDDGDADVLNDDEELKFEKEDLYWADVSGKFTGTAATDGTLTAIYDSDSKKLFFITNKTDDVASAAGFPLTDRPLIFADPEVVADKDYKFNDFDEDGYGLNVWLRAEDGNLYASTANPWAYASGADINGDMDDNDILIYIKNDDGEEVVVDMFDRDQGDNHGTMDYDNDYENSLGVYKTDCNPATSGASNCTYNNVTLTWDCTNVTFDGCELVGGSGGEYTTSSIGSPFPVMDSDKATWIIVPGGGDEFTIDWWTDNRIDGVEICHPKVAVDSTYFIGTEETSETVVDEITEEDVGKEVEVACCTFTVSNFTMSGAGEEQEYTETSVNPIVGNLVVPEIGADTTKSLIIVGGPSVNGMAEGLVTLEDVEGEADGFVVKLAGNKLIVAGKDAEDTVAGGDALIEWLNENIH